MKEKQNLLNTDCLLHGGDYNPDQWLDYPDILEEDVRLMKEACVNCVTLGVFSWSRLEPEEGVFDFDWLEEIINRLYREGICTILATPTGAMPHWLTEKYEEVRKMNGDGVRRKHGQRHNFCPSSPVMRRKMRGINKALSERFGNNPAVIAWHISNEYGGDVDGVDCHCPYCEAAFQDWLKKRYQTLDALNHAWWTGFWSNTYTEWTQIHSPSQFGEHTMHGVKLDWKRFVSSQILDFCKDEIKSIRAASKKPVTVNMMGSFEPLDYFKWAKEVDLTALDSYPFWHMAEDDAQMGMLSSFNHTLTRSLKKQPYLLMESVPSAVNWAPKNTLKRPGMHELSSLQAVAHGSNSVQYFQWRKSRGGSEKYHGAVIDHKNGADTRVFRDVKRLGERLRNISARVLGTCNRPKIAILFDWENGWAADDAQAVVNPLEYRRRWMEYYRGFWEMGIDVDIIDMDDSMDGYSLVVAPLNYMYRGKYADNVRRFVESGGTYVTTYWSGEVDESDLCFLGEHPLRDVLGIRTEEIDVMPEHVKNTVLCNGKSYAIKELCSIVHAESAEVLAVYEKDFYAGYPALTRNKYGKGTAYYIAAEADTEFIKDLYHSLTEETGTACTLKADFPAGVTVTERKGTQEQKSLWFVQNFNAGEAAVSLGDVYRDIESGQTMSGDIILEGYQCLILEKV